MRLVLLGLTFLALLSCSEEKEQTVFEYVCQEVEAEYGTPCGDLGPPLPVLTQVLNFVKGGPWMGAYVGGERYVFVNPISPDIRGSLMHETVHYVLYNVADVGTDKQCESEEVARRIAGQTGDKWREKYGCADT